MSTKVIKGISCALIIAAMVGLIQNRTLEKVNHTIVSELDQRSSNKLFQLKSVGKFPDIGFRNITAGWSFLSFLQYFGDEQNRSREGYDLSSDYLSVVLEHDPYYRPFYLFLSESTTFYAGMPDKTVEIIEKGLSHLEEHRASDSYYIWRYKGTDELLFLGKGQAAKKSFEMAAEWAKESNEENSKLMASLSHQTAVFLASDPDSVNAKIGAWSSVLMTSQDKGTQRRAINKIRELGGQVTISKRGGISIKHPSEEKGI